VIVCWDLDNTLVDSGTLLRQGMSLTAAVGVAAPMTRMIEFFVAVSEAIPAAEHVVLSARPGSLRAVTMDWMRRHSVHVTDDRVWLVPDARVKVAVWRCLARRARLVIVDDLSYGHEGDLRAVYEDLVAEALRIASVYVGLTEIESVTNGRSIGIHLADQVAERACR
jgi:hypothetical protein